MPALPFDYVEPFAATLGTMLYPGPDEESRDKALTFSKLWLTKPLKEFFGKGGDLSIEELRQITTQGSTPLDDVERRWYMGTAMGQMMKVYFSLAHHHPDMASWNSARKITLEHADTCGARGSDTFLSEVRAEFKSVAHLWGAFCIRGLQFSEAPDVGYSYAADFDAFLKESEIIRDWGQNWRPNRAKSEPPLPHDVWCPPDTWKPLVRQRDWPVTGAISDFTLPPDYIAILRPAGRPKKSI